MRGFLTGLCRDAGVALRTQNVQHFLHGRLDAIHDHGEDPGRCAADQHCTLLIHGNGLLPVPAGNIPEYHPGQLIAIALVLLLCPVKVCHIAATHRRVKLHIGDDIQRLGQLLLGQPVLQSNTQDQLKDTAQVGIGDLVEAPGVPDLFHDITALDLHQTGILREGDKVVVERAGIPLGKIDSQRLSHRRGHGLLAGPVHGAGAIHDHQSVPVASEVLLGIPGHIHGATLPVRQDLAGNRGCDDVIGVQGIGVHDCLTARNLIQIRAVALPVVPVEGLAVLEQRPGGLRRVGEGVILLTQVVLQNPQGFAQPGQNLAVLFVAHAQRTSHLSGGSYGIVYVNFDAEGYVNPEPLFEFEITSPTKTSSRAYPTEAGLDYIKRLMQTDTVTYYNDTLWVNKFHGLYVVPEQTDSESKVIYRTETSYTGLELWLRDHDSIDNNLILDTVVASYACYAEKAKAGNIAANMVYHDYEGSLVADLGVNDTLASDPVQRTIYVEGMGGVMGYVKVTDQFVEKLAELGDEAKNGGYSTVSINQAMAYFPLTVNVKDPAERPAAIPFLDAAPTRLGMYTAFASLTGIPDYDYEYEESLSNYGDQYKLPYGGELNRSRGCYAMDVTAYIQRMWSEYQRADGNLDEVKYRSIFVAPAADDMFTLGQVALQGNDAIEIVLTYTLMR